MGTLSAAGLTPVLAYTIEGSVEHVERMPSMSADLKAGAEFNQSTVKVDPGNKWVKLPTWFAGTWLVKQETAVYQKDFRTGKVIDQHKTYQARQEFGYGHQVDRQGNVWHYVGVPYTSKSRLMEYDEYHKVSSKDFQAANDNEVRFRSVMDVIRVNPSTDTIVTSFQQESITSYRPVGEGVIELTSSTKSFNSAGLPQHETCNTATIKRSKPFKPVAEKDGKDLVALFHAFLTSQGLTNLI